jgi:hypothetical protein
MKVFKNIYKRLNIIFKTVRLKENLISLFY